MFKETLAALNLRVDLNGQTYTPKLKPGDMVRFEERFGRSLFDGANLDSNTPGIAFGVTELFFLAFVACRRVGHFDGDFDAFCDVVDDVDLEDEPAPKAG